MVIRPITTYTTKMWWQRVDYKTSRAKPSMLRRLACLGKTGAIRTGPTAATEALLGLPSLPLKLEAETLVGIYRPSFNKQWKPRSIWYGHAKKVRDMMKESILQMGTDKMIMRYVMNRNEWEKGSIPIK
jgi:hypothetical protein